MHKNKINTNFCFSYLFGRIALIFIFNNKITLPSHQKKELKQIYTNYIIVFTIKKVYHSFGITLQAVSNIKSKIL